MEQKKAILIVSFGTSYEDTRKKTLKQIEKDISAEFPEYIVKHAFTSEMIIRKLNIEQNIKIPTVGEALEQLLQDGATDIVMQPTHIINGIENDNMLAAASKWKHRFRTILTGSPLITTTDDQRKVLHAAMEEFNPIGEKEALIFMGHGSSHDANTVYAALDYMLKDLGYENAFMGTVEAYPSLDTICKKLTKHDIEHIYLVPFMVVAGDHAKNDMAGTDENSWQVRLCQKGYRVTSILRGLGELKLIRDIYISHLKDAFTKIQEIDYDR